MSRVGAIAALVLLAACGGGEEVGQWCPNVQAVAGLDRLAIAYPGAAEPVPTRLDIVQTACAVDGADLLVGAAVAVRVGPERPPGELVVPLTVVLDSPEGPRDAASETVTIPADAPGATTYFEHRFSGLATRDDVALRLLYALVPDAATRERLAVEGPQR